ncbi:ribonuclease H-like domain-containing protein [Sparassis latifolia]
MALKCSRCLPQIARDNASNNDIMMVELARLLTTRGVNFDAKDNQVRCFAHVINLCAQAILSSLSDTLIDEEIVIDPLTKGEVQSFEQAAARDLIALDMNRQLACFRLSLIEWEVLKEFEVMLKIPRLTTNKLSIGASPMLSAAVPAIELLQTSWEKLHDRNRLQVQPYVSVGIKKVSEYYKWMDDTRAYVITLFLNSAIKMTWVQKYWGKDYICQSKETVLALMREYAAHLGNQNAGASAVEVSAAQPTYAAVESLTAQYNLVDDFMLAHPEGNIKPVEQEYNVFFLVLFDSGYTNSCYLPHIQLYYKDFPMLHAIALDYLPVQPTSMPSERVFSSSSDTDTKKRSRITAPLMEALQMLKFSLKHERTMWHSLYLTDEKMLLPPIESDDDLLNRLFMGGGDNALDSIIVNDDCAYDY